MLLKTCWSDCRECLRIWKGYWSQWRMCLGPDEGGGWKHKWLVYVILGLGEGPPFPGDIFRCWSDSKISLLWGSSSFDITTEPQRKWIHRPTASQNHWGRNGRHFISARSAGSLSTWSISPEDPQLKGKLWDLWSSLFHSHCVLLWRCYYSSSNPGSCGCVYYSPLFKHGWVLSVWKWKQRPKFLISGHLIILSW